MSTKKKPKKAPKLPVKAKKAPAKAVVKKKAKTTAKTPKGKAAGAGTIGFGVTSSERKMFKDKAKQYAGGNLSAFLRHAATVCKTKATEF